MERIGFFVGMGILACGFWGSNYLFGQAMENLSPEGERHRARLYFLTRYVSKLLSSGKDFNELGKRYRRRALMTLGLVPLGLFAMVAMVAMHGHPVTTAAHDPSPVVSHAGHGNAYLDRYSWFFVAGVWLVQVVAWRARMSRLVTAGQLNNVDVRRFVRVAALAVPIPCVALGVIAVWTRFPLWCSTPLSFRSFPDAAENTVTLLSWLALLWWVWLGQGAQLLSSVSPGFSRAFGPTNRVSPSRVRAVVTGLLLIAGCGGVLASRSVSPAPECAAYLDSGAANP